MIPSSNIKSFVETVEQPTKSYNMHLNSEKIYGYCDNLSAMEQVVYKILSTKRYEHLIYSWDFGIELDDLFNEPKSYVCSELKRRISEALIQDDRIESVDDFSFDCSKRNVIHAFFVVHTVFGDLKSEREVNY